MTKHEQQHLGYGTEVRLVSTMAVKIYNNFGAQYKTIENRT